MAFVPGMPFVGGASRRYRINQSLRFRASNSAFLSWTRIGGTSAADTSILIKTYDFWVKRGQLSIGQTILSNWLDSNNFWQIAFNASDQLEFRQVGISVGAGVTAALANTSMLFRDPSAWYHINIRVDTGQTTAADRFRVQVNGVSQTLSYTTFPAISTAVCSFFTPTAGTYTMRWGQRADSSFAADVYLAEVRAADGQALAASSFGQTDTATNSWVPRRYTGTYGTNGFYLPFNDATSTTTISQDRSGNGNNWTSSGISVSPGVTFDQMLDSPTNNFPTFTSIFASSSSYPITRAGLRLDGSVSYTAASPWYITSGKWYWEVQGTGYAGAVVAQGANFGVSLSAAGSRGIGYWSLDGVVYYDGGSSAGGSSYTASNVVGVALDKDANTISFYRDNVLQSTVSLSVITGGTTGVFPAYSDGGGVHGADFNFGQRPFAYTPPTGFLALNTANLPTPVIPRGDVAFDVALWAGNSAARTITLANSQLTPDLVWIKARSIAYNNIIADSARGFTTGRKLATNTTDAEGAAANPDSDGYVSGVGAGSFNLSVSGGSGWNQTNVTGQNYVGWAMREGAAYGFDVVLYTGNGAAQTINHGLNAVPHFMIVKTRTSPATYQGWAAYHRNANASPANGSLFLNTTAAFATDSTVFNNVAPTSSQFSVGTNMSGNLATYVAYLWTSIPGFSLFGSYTGNGSTDGPFVWCGFRPRFVMIKRVDSTGQWAIYDTARNTFNETDLDLSANTSAAETSTDPAGVDVTASGFKVRGTSLFFNASGGTYIFAAFAENPFKFANAR